MVPQFSFWMLSRKALNKSPLISNRADRSRSEILWNSLLLLKDTFPPKWAI